MVRRASDPDAVFFLTAGHVLLAREATKGDAVLQPGADLGGVDPSCRIGTLDSWVHYEPNPQGTPNRADVALVRIADGDSVSRHISGVGAPLGEDDHLYLGMPIQLYGRTSGYQRGYVVDLAYSIQYPIALPGLGEVDITFTRLVLCTKCTAGGDSGAAVLSMQRKVVGIHLGGSRTASFFCPISAIRDALGVDVAV